MKDSILTAREEDLLNFIISFKKTNQFAPTVTEMCRGINTKSRTHICYMLENLKKKGYISYKEKTSRSIIVKKFLM